MIEEALLSFLHLSAILGWVVFASSQAALCRADWLNPAAVRRLARLDTILWLATAAVLLTGLARIYLGIKGAAWYWHNPLLWLKLALFVLAVLLLPGATRRYRRWRAQLDAGGPLPPEAEVRAARRLVMVATHLVAVIPLAAVFMARGYSGFL
jgi:putative membrane protein